MANNNGLSDKMACDECAMILDVDAKESEYLEAPSIQTVLDQRKHFKGAPNIKLQLHLAPDKIESFQVPTSVKVAWVRSLVSSCAKIHPNNFRLLYLTTQELKSDDSTLEEMGILNDATILVCQRVTKHGGDTAMEHLREKIKHYSTTPSIGLEAEIKKKPSSI